MCVKVVRSEEGGATVVVPAIAPGCHIAVELCQMITTGEN